MVDGVLSFGLCYDTPDITRDLAGADLERWGVSLQEAVERSITNLRGLSTEPLLLSQQDLQLGPWADSHAASRLLCPEVFSMLPLEGQLVASVPDQNTILLADSANREAMAAMMDESERRLERARLVYPPPLVYDEGRWCILEVPKSDELHGSWRRLTLLTQAMVHNRQQQLLTAWYHAQGKNVYVSKLDVARKDNQVFTIANWAAFASTVLPRADKVLLLSGSGEQMKAVGCPSWLQLVERWESHLEELEGWPPRYLARGFPTAEQLRELNG